MVWGQSCSIETNKKTEMGLKGRTLDGTWQDFLKGNVALNRLQDKYICVAFGLWTVGGINDLLYLIFILNIADHKVFAERWLALRYLFVVKVETGSGH